MTCGVKRLLPGSNRRYNERCPGIVGAQESLGEGFVDLPSGKTEGMIMMKSVCAVIGLATIAMLSIPLSLYGA